MSSDAGSMKGGITFIWKIENFSMCTQKQGEKIISPTFPSELSSILLNRCFLHLYPRGTGTDESVSVVLQREQPCSNICVDIQIRYSISLLRADGSVHVSREFESTTNADDLAECAKLASREEIFKQKTVFLPNDTLTLKCYIWGYLPHIGVMAEFYRACTRIELEKYTGIFTLKNVSCCQRKHYNTGIYSVPLGKPILDMHFWKTDDVENWIKINISDKRLKKTKPMFAKCKLTVLGSDSKGKHSIHDDHLFQPREKDIYWNLPPFISKTMLSNEVEFQNEELCVLYEFMYTEGKETVCFEESSTMPTAYQHLLPDKVTSKKEKPTMKLGEHLRNLYLEKQFCDITLRAGEIEYQAHRNILSARSPVFCAMFERDMLEKHRGIVEIPDVESPTLNLLLLFLYTDTIEDLDWDNAAKLYAAADKYAVLTLREKCMALLIRSLSVENVCSALAMAELHEDDGMKTAAQIFIRSNAKDVFESKEWNIFMEVNSQLAAKTMKQAWPL